MTTITQRLQVADVVCATAPARDDVIDHVCSDDSSIACMHAKRVVAQWMALQKPLRQAPPSDTVATR